MRKITPLAASCGASGGDSSSFRFGQRGVLPTGETWQICGAETGFALLANTAACFERTVALHGDDFRIPLRYFATPRNALAKKKQEQHLISGAAIGELRKSPQLLLTLSS
jgi:hypothetical protein